MRRGSRFWMSIARVGTPRRLPRQRTATQFMSGESVKILPLTGDLTYGLSPTTYAKAPPPTACRSRRRWSAGLFKLYCGRIRGGVAVYDPPYCFYYRFHPINACRGVLMIAKRSSRALALLLALPSAAFALGLGDIRLLSPLNAPLEAEIDLVDVTPEEMGTVPAQLASRDTFARYGLDWPPYLAGVQVKTLKTGDGREVIKLKSTDPISDPFVTLLVEVNWARGKLVREYTMLLDPPVFTPGQPQVASAPVSAPAVGGGTHEGTIARAADTAAPTAARAMPAAAAEMPTASTAAVPTAAALAAAAPAAEAVPAPTAAPVRTAAETAAPPAETAPAAAEAATAVAEPPPPPAPAPITAQTSAATAPAPISEATPAPEPDTAAAAPPAASPAESAGTHAVRR